jgi:hypothetical protein
MLALVQCISGGQLENADILILLNSSQTDEGCEERRSVQYLINLSLPTLLQSHGHIFVPFIL